MNTIDELPGIFQAIGKLGMRLSRCKHGSPLHQKTWNKMVELENQASEIISSLRMRNQALLSFVQGIAQDERSPNWALYKEAQRLIEFCKEKS